ncbi:MAG: ribosome biogenesis GTP-binding protein YsxC [Saprospiraceae bacterium]|nr:ribosome biogenesis GTP-binding protein YsxC [Saprospiraceae bacterium]
MVIHDVEFYGSFPKFDQVPKSAIPEFCFWGRSNVGKSSMINYLMNRKDLARISSMPGKTQQFNLFQVNNKSYNIMDLPGYGYAKVSKSIHEKWQGQINKYLVQRENLMNVFLLVDISVPPQAIDLEKIGYFGEHEIPFTILFTKSDKCKKMELQKNLDTYQKKLLETWDNLPPIILTSVEKTIGKEAIFEVLDICINQ